MAVAGDPRILELTAPEGDLVAQFATHVGMVGCSLRHHGEELLGLGGGLDAYTTQGKVFGIPLLYPWANRLGDWSYAVAGRRVVLDRESPLLHGDAHCLPIHGALAATSDWTVRDAGESWLLAELDFGAHPDLLAVFPFAHRLELAVHLRAGRLTITTSIIAGPAAPVPLSFGFHPYLALPGAPREAWIVEMPVRTELALDAFGLPTGEGRERPRESFELGARTYDDLFALPGPSRFSVAAAGRRATVEMTSGFPYAQVYAPPDQPVICFEPMTAPVDALRSHDGLRLVPAGETARTTFTLTVEELSLDGLGPDEPAAA
jgi:galactose mutarotase-like enzyme